MTNECQSRRLALREVTKMREIELKLESEKETILEK